MGLKTTFRNIPVIIFDVFKDLVVKATYQRYSENLLEDKPSTPVTFDMIVIETTKKDIYRTNFENIQPLDRLGYVRGVDITFTVQNGDRITVDDTVYEIVNQEIIAADALYMLLLRKAA